MNVPAEESLDLSWAELDRVLWGVADEVSAGGVPDVVVGVLRGGMVPAVVLAHRLGVRDVRGFEVSRTLSNVPLAETNPPLVATLAGLDGLAGLDVVLIDVVAASGATAEAATTVVLSAEPARLRRVVTVLKSASWDRPSPDDDPFRYFDYVGIACDSWVRLPWEITQ